MKFLRTLLILGRVSNLPTVWTNVLAGWMLAGGSWESGLAWMAGGISLLYVAGMTLNDVFDAGWDGEHAPERPIPRGDISRPAAAAAGLLQMGAGVLILATQTGAHPNWYLGLVTAILLYNWLHKKWAGSVLVMGACRALVYLTAASAGGGWTFPLLLYAGCMLVYIAGITLAARGERSAGGRAGWLGRVLVFFPAASLLAMPHESPGARAMYAGAGILLAVGWLAFCLRRLGSSIAGGVTALLAGICLLDAAAIASADPGAALLALGMLPLTRFLQRFVPAT